MGDSNRFQFTKSDHLNEVMLLNAEMEDFSYGRHAHEEFSFAVTLAGRQDFYCGGTFHKSPPGNIILFNPEEVHDGHSGVDERLRYAMFYIHPKQLAPWLECVGVKRSHSFYVRETLVQDPVLRASLLNLAGMMTAQPNNSIEQEHELLRVAARLAQRADQFDMERHTSRLDRQMARAKEYIQAHCCRELSLDDVSNEINLSKYHFVRLFHRQFGITPHQYIVNCRVNQARVALESGRSLSDVALDCGFSDLSHFNRRFKPIFGMTPHQYQMGLNRHQ